jgi:hypothetical protein
MVRETDPQTDPSEPMVRVWHRRSMTDQELIDALRIAFMINDAIEGEGGIENLPSYLSGKGKVALLAEACLELAVRHGSPAILEAQRLPPDRPRARRAVSNRPR